ncbi:hypothetical protein [Desulfurispira natronophila]|uniref:Uncharacterized protein n=1 Tax=Desulfurispira natronophila TaxID=682562 RepID=A0A7W7Y687_9BACT|nr:hypothetical protein [Desulfurispira natronophila]MBB5022823.1 hypothetical protein [Desulfurispira natronophila]
MYLSPTYLLRRAVRLWSVPLAALLISTLLPGGSAAMTTFGIQFEQQPSSGLNSNSAKVESRSQRLNVSQDNYRFSYTRTRYSWDQPWNLPSALDAGGEDPWGTLQRINFGYGNREAGETWNTYYGLGLGARYEREVEKAYSLFGYTMWGYNHSDDWETGIGIAVAYTPLREYVLPMGFVRYRAPMQEGISASLGFPNTQIRYRFDRQLSVGAKASFGQGNFRLKDNSPLQSAGYVDMAGYQATGFVEYMVVPGTILSLELSSSINRRWRIYDADGNRQGRVNLDDGVSTALVLRQMF